MSKMLLAFLLGLFTITYAPSFAEKPRQCTAKDPCEVGVKTQVFFDKSRERPLITEIYYPSEKNLPSVEPTSNNFRLLQEARNAPLTPSMKKLPLIVVSHGPKSDRYALTWLQEILAANGYIVAAPDHFGDTIYLHRSEESLKQWERPKDITYVIDQVLNDPFFKQHVDPEKIGFIGYLTGGLTGVWLAGGRATQYPMPQVNPQELDDCITQAMLDKIDFTKAQKSYEDKRIKAELLLAPSYGQAFDKNGLARVDIPMLILNLEKNKAAPSKENAQYLADYIKSSGLKILPGDTERLVFPKKLCPQKGLETNDRTLEEIADNTLKFFDKYLKNPSQH